MMILAYIVVVGVGIALLVIGVRYWLLREQLKSDPVLIACCIASGFFLIVSTLMTAL